MNDPTDDPTNSETGDDIESRYISIKNLPNGDPHSIIDSDEYSKYVEKFDEFLGLAAELEVSESFARAIRIYNEAIYWALEQYDTHYDSFYKLSIAPIFASDSLLVQAFVARAECKLQLGAVQEVYGEYQEWQFSGTPIPEVEQKLEECRSKLLQILAQTKSSIEELLVEIQDELTLIDSEIKNFTQLEIQPNNLNAVNTKITHKLSCHIATIDSIERLLDITPEASNMPPGIAATKTRFEEQIASLRLEIVAQQLRALEIARAPQVEAESMPTPAAPPMLMTPLFTAQTSTSSLAPVTTTSNVVGNQAVGAVEDEMLFAHPAPRS